MTLIAKSIFARKPSGIEWTQSGLQDYRRNIKEAGSWPSTQIFVTAADQKISLHRRYIDGDNSDGMIRINQQPGTGRMAGISQRLKLMHDLPVHKHDL